MLVNASLNHPAYMGTDQPGDGDNDKKVARSYCSALSVNPPCGSSSLRQWALHLRKQLEQLLQAQHVANTLSESPRRHRNPKVVRQLIPSRKLARLEMKVLSNEPSIH